jgi:hypothetical protein
VPLYALLDTGADYSYFDIAYAAVLKLDPTKAEKAQVRLGDRSIADSYSWPFVDIQFGHVRVKFEGYFYEPQDPDAGSPGPEGEVGVLGRQDFMRAFALHFWEQEEKFCVDLPPGAPQALDFGVLR